MEENIFFQFQDPADIYDVPICCQIAILLIPMID